ncbi:MAG TPA: 30S ribosome-binding factor RbfA [Vicinamibacteria bacterium]|nr:30S ribosome-binding factor RbfA [Vicinamibacteria bacterium]
MSHRQDRLGGEIRQEVAQIVAGLKDPRLGFVTVTRAELTSDYRLARIFVGVWGSEAERQKSLAALKQATGFVRRELGRRLTIRHTPEVQFVYDKGLEAADRVAQALDRVRAEDAESALQGGDPPDSPGDDER